MGHRSGSKVADDLAAIEDMDRSGLLTEWERCVGTAPPRHASVKLMRSVLSWEAQAKDEGGLPSSVSRMLRSRAHQIFGNDRQDSDRNMGAVPNALNGVADEKDRQASRQVTSTLRPGVQLMREWNGRTYRVEVVKDGFRMDGRDYASLTAIARRITGSHWSGPRFFGLSGKRSS